MAQARALGQQAVLLLILLWGVRAATADTTNFVGDFDESFWAAAVGAGSATFSDTNTLVLAGPNAPTVETSSLDAMRYEGQLQGGLLVGGTVQFNWAYNSGDALSTSEAEIAWTPSGGSPVQIALAQGGPGVITNGFYMTPVLAAGTTFEFALGTDTLADKLSGTLVITGFVFQEEVPEPSAGLLLGTALMCLGLARWRRLQRPR